MGSKLYFEGQVNAIGTGAIRFKGVDGGGNPVSFIIEGVGNEIGGSAIIRGTVSDLPIVGGQDGQAIRWPVHQVGHNFLLGQPITETSTGWVKSSYDNVDLAADAVCGGVIGPDDFIAQQFGTIEQPEANWEVFCNLHTVGAGLPKGEYLWTEWDGHLTQDQPSGLVNFQQPALKAQSSTLAEILIPSEAVIPGVGGGAVSTDGLVTKEVHQVGHGFIVGNAISHPGISWVKADITDNTKSCEGVVESSSGPDDFVVRFIGPMTLPAASWDLVLGTTGGPIAGQFYALSINGLMTSTPTGAYEQVIMRALSNTDVLIDRGDLIFLTVGGALTSDLNLYVDVASGNDSNSGLSSGAAFATIQHAVDVASTYRTVDTGASSRPSVVINLANGTYTEAVFVSSSSARIKFTGSTSAVWNNTTAGGWCLAVTSSTVSISGITFGGSASSRGIIALDGAVLNILGGHVFAQVATQHIAVARNSTGYISGNYTISGSAIIHYGIYDTSSLVFTVSPTTITVSGTPAYSIAFCDVGRLGSINVGDATTVTFSGAATGKRYQCYNGGQIWTNGKGINLFPGSVAGTVASSGAYT